MKTSGDQRRENAPTYSVVITRDLSAEAQRAKAEAKQFRNCPTAKVRIASAQTRLAMTCGDTCKILGIILH
jgi:hypothetical protein